MFCLSKNRARWIQFVIGLILAFVWIRSALAHIDNPYLFLITIYKYRLTGIGISPAIATVLPWIQLTIATCLIGRVFVPGALLSSALLLSFFALVQSSAFFRGLRIDCGCFGGGQVRPISETSIAAVSGLAIAAFVAFMLYRYQQSSPSHAQTTD